MREFALWLHIMGAGIWLGANITQAVIGPRMSRSERGALPWFKAVESGSGVIYGTASLLILLPGIYLVVSSDAFSFGSAFVGIGIAVLIIGGALAGLVFNRKTRQIISLHEEGNDAQAGSVSQSIAVWGVIDTLLIAFAILAMVAKWGA